MAGQLQSLRNQLSTRTKSLNELRKGSVAKSAMTGGVFLGAAAAGGFLDRAVGEDGIGGIPASTGLGIVGATAGVLLKSPYAISASAGLLADAARKLGEQAYDATLGASSDEDDKK